MKNNDGNNDEPLIVDEDNSDNGFENNDICRYKVGIYMYSLTRNKYFVYKCILKE